MTQHTDPAVVQSLLHRAFVKTLIIEDLRPKKSIPANPSYGNAGKLKNHWTFRLILRYPVSVGIPGEKKAYESVRASVEPGNSPTCPNITLKPLPYAGYSSRSALAEWRFPVEGDTSVAHFLEAATQLLPFTYRVVSRTEIPPNTTDSKKDKGRGEIVDNRNGCRDFTTQWFISCYNRRIVAWEPSEWMPNDAVQKMPSFHEIIGYRYSFLKDGKHEGRVDPSPIVRAYFPPSYTRICELDAQIKMHPPSSGLINREESIYHVILPYEAKDAPKDIPIYQEYKVDSALSQ